MYVLMIDKDDDYDLPDVHGPFADVAAAQRYARAWREQHGVPGHDHDVPTSEENEAWTDLGWFFAIVEPSLELADAEYVHDPPSFPPQKVMRCADEKGWPEHTFDLQGDGPTYCCSHCGWAQESFGGGLFELCWSASWHSAASYGLFADEATRQGCKDVPAWPLNIEPDTAPPAHLRSYRFPHSDPEETP